MSAYLLAIGVLCGIGLTLSVLLVLAQLCLTEYGECTINVNDDEEFVVDGGCSLLDALYANEIYIPSACGGQGTCGYCTVKVLSGGGPVLPTELPHLSRPEQRMGMRLACQVKVREDMGLWVKPEYLEVEQFDARVKSARMLTPDTRELDIDLLEPEEINFSPGQYVQVSVPTSEGPVIRAYSIATEPEVKDWLRLVVRLIPGGIGSTYLHDIEEGEELTFTGPYGEYQLSKDPETEIVCVAGGCGMAPIRSIARHIANNWPERKCYVFFGARGKKDLFYDDEFNELAQEYPGIEFYPALSDPDPDDQWEGETGFIHTAVDKHLEPGKKREAFLCGPPPMIEATTEVLHEKGLKDHQIYYDEF